MDHLEKSAPEVPADKLAHPNSNEVVFELSQCKERVENKLAVCMFTLYERHLYPKVRPSASDLEFFLCRRKIVHGAYYEFHNN
jgi:hypothetical protein